MFRLILRDTRFGRADSAFEGDFNEMKKYGSEFFETVFRLPSVEKVELELLDAVCFCQEPGEVVGAFQFQLAVSKSQEKFLDVADIL